MGPLYPADAWKEGPALDAELGAFAPGYMPSSAQQEQKLAAVQAYLDRNSFVAKPYQDVSCRVRGPVLPDLNHNFCQAWQESTPPQSLLVEFVEWLVTTASRLAGHMPMGAIQRAAALVPPVPVERKLDPDSRLVRHMPMGTIQRAATLVPPVPVERKSEPDFIQVRHAIPPQAFQLREGRHSVQLLRTQPVHGEKTIKECYANITRQLHHYIFIQNQYVQYAPWSEHLKACVQTLRAVGFVKPIYVFILTSTPESDGMDLPTYDVASGIGQSATMVVEHRDALEKARKGKAPMPVTPEDMSQAGINVVMGSLWTCADKPPGTRLIPSHYEEIYIHAKVAIVDDVAFTLGSANLNLRSMALDSELNILSEAHEVAYQLRMDLFKQCTGNPGPAKFGDMVDTFKKWKDLMRDNERFKSSGQPLTCQLLPFHVDRQPGSPVI